MMYTDESGDPGLSNSPTTHYVLSGVVLHELRWRPTLDQLVQFRRRMSSRFGLRMHEEIHGARMISHPGSLSRIRRNDRLTIIRFFANEIATLNDLSIINVVVDKRTKQPGYDVFSMAWKTLIQRFENTIIARNFPGPRNADERGIIFPDSTDNKKLQQLTRQMHRYNPVPHQPRFGLGYRNLAISNVIEDPNPRSSSDSYFIQISDLAAYLLQQEINPNAYIRRKGATTYFNRLGPVLCTVASTNDPRGIVWL